jgi:anti-sigma factor RsiW
LKEHLSQSQIEDYRRQALAPAELLSVSDHLGACEACRSRVEGVLDCTAAFFGIRTEVFGDTAGNREPTQASPHPVVEQIARYVDGELAEQELQAFQDHVATCEECALGVADLRTFKGEIAATLERGFLPAALPVQNGGSRHRLAEFLTGPTFRTPAFGLGATLAAFLLLAAGGLVWRSLQKREIISGLTQTEAPATAVPSKAPAGVLPEARVELNDGGGRIVLNPGRRLSGADILPAEYRQLVQEALINPQLPKSSQLTGLRRPTSTLMGGGSPETSFALVEPVGALVLADRPVFRWSLLDGATGYIAEVYDEKFNPMAISPLVTGTSWTTPHPLRRGRIYSWQVRAFKDGLEFKSPRPPAPQAKFRILDQAKADELLRAQKAYPSFHLALGLLCARAGLLEDADRELLALRKANPDSAVASRLLEELREMKR